MDRYLPSDAEKYLFSSGLDSFPYCQRQLSSCGAIVTFSRGFAWIRKESSISKSDGEMMVVSGVTAGTCYTTGT